jgi:hypothetical protein
MHAFGDFPSYYCHRMQQQKIKPYLHKYVTISMIGMDILDIFPSEELEKQNFPTDYSIWKQFGFVRLTFSS